jgi:hypothetical protein
MPLNKMTPSIFEINDTQNNNCGIQCINFYFLTECRYGDCRYAQRHGTNLNTAYEILIKLKFFLASKELCQRFQLLPEAAQSFSLFCRRLSGFLLELF